MDKQLQDRLYAAKRLLCVALFGAIPPKGDVLWDEIDHMIAQEIRHAQRPRRPRVVVD